MTFTYPSHTAKGCVPLSSDVMKKELIDSSDIVVIFENIRCVVDAETEIVLGSLPFV